MNEYICKHCGINAEQMHATLRRAGEKYLAAIELRKREYAERCELSIRIHGVVKKMEAALATESWMDLDDAIQGWIEELTGKGGCDGSQKTPLQ